VVTDTAGASADLEAGSKALDAGDFEAARESLRSATAKDPKNAQAFFKLGVACEKIGDLQAAEAAYRRALASRPDLDAAVAALSALYVSQGRTDEALAVGRAGLRAHPGSAAIHASFGAALASMGQQEVATHELEQAVSIAPSDPMFRLALAHWLNAWHVRGAAFHLDAAIASAKDDYGLLASIGHEYRMAGEFASCAKTFDKAIANKDGGEVRTERALCKLGLKDEVGATKDLRQATELEPTYAPGHYYLGGRLATARRFNAAKHEYETYLQLAPNGSLAEEATQRLQAAETEALAVKRARAEKP
jgi:Flp pilus assembly protein TadD